MNAAFENPALAATLGLGMIGLGTWAYLTGEENQQLLQQALFLALQRLLEDEADKVYPEVTQQISDILLEISSREEAPIPPRVLLNVFAHSHGGMVADKLLSSEEFKKIIEETFYPFELNIRFYIAGCPVLVKQPSVKNIWLRQLHNTNDLISLLFVEKDLRHPKKLPKHVVSTKLRGYHASILYAQHLHLLL